MQSSRDFSRTPAIVLDASVILNAANRFLGRSNYYLHRIAGQALEHARSRYTLTFTEPTLGEIKTALLRKPEFSHLDAQGKSGFLTALERDGMIVRATHGFNRCAQPKDNEVVIAALSSHSSYLVTLDDRLRSLGQVQDCKFVNPEQFLSAEGIPLEMQRTGAPGTQHQPRSENPRRGLFRARRGPKPGSGR